MKKYLISGVLVATLYIQPAHAASSAEGHELSVGAGISSPSSTTALEESPAGLTYNSSLKVLGFIETDNDQFDPLDYGATLYTGNHQIGAAVGLKTTPADHAQINLGLATQVDAIQSSLGVAGRHTFVTGSGWDWDLGLIHDPKGKTRVGLSAFGLSNGVSDWGAGVASDFNSSATATLDASIDSDGNGLTLKPALGVHVSDLQITAGYGIDLDSTHNSWIREGFALGIGFKLSERFHFEAYYHQLAEYFFGISAHL